MAEQKKSGLGKFLPLAILVLGLGLFFAFGLHERFTFEWLSANYTDVKALVNDYRTLAWIAFFALYFISTAFSLPIATLLTLGGGAILGWPAAVLVIVAATMGAFVLFLAARGAFAATMEAKAGPFMTRIKAGFNDSPFLWLLTLRLVPAFPFWLVNIAPALLGMRSRDYLLATIIGIAPGSTIYVLVGSGTIASILESGGSLTGNEVGALFGQPTVWGPLVALAALSLIPIIVKRLRKGKDKMT